MLLSDVLLQGLRADQPLPADVPTASLYYVTDEGVLEQNDGASWVPYSTSEGTGLIRRAVVELTNAEILALYNTPFEIVPAPGASMYIKLIAYTLRANIGVVYTGLDPVYSDFHLGSGTFYAGYGPINDNTTTPALSWLTQLLGTVATQIWNGVVPDIAATSVAGTSLYVQPESMPPAASLLNAPLEAFIENGGTPIGGGNAANTLKIVVYYSIEDLS